MVIFGNNNNDMKDFEVFELDVVVVVRAVETCSAWYFKSPSSFEVAAEKSCKIFLKN